MSRTISRTDFRACDNWIAREHDVVVLPRQAQRRGRMIILPNAR